MNKKLKVKSQKSKVEKIQKKRAVVLLSGGIDSATTLYLAKKQGYEAFCLIFDYGQRHKKEIRRAEKIARKAKSHWRLLKFELPGKGSSLIDRGRPIPEHRQLTAGIPSTYVPARNIIFLSFASSYAESIKARAIFIGANEVDFSGYPDCRHGFLKAFERTLRVGMKIGVEGKKISILAPLIKKSKAQIVKLALKLDVPIEDTWSCYRGRKSPCHVCDSCRLRRRGFAQAKIEDPAL